MNKELKKRIITSIILIAIVLNCLFINNFSWLLLLSIVSFICWFEFINLNKKIWKKKPIIVFPIILSFLFLLIFVYAAYELRRKLGADAILFILGSGPVKGFSVTLGVGILTTLFSVYFIARLITSIYVSKNKHKEKLI